MTTGLDNPLRSEKDLANIQTRFSGSGRKTTSPLTLKIIAFNLVALSLLVTGILYLNQRREGLTDMRKATLIADAGVLALSIEQQMLNNPGMTFVDARNIDSLQTLSSPMHARAQLFSAQAKLLTLINDQALVRNTLPPATRTRTNSIDDIAGEAWDRLSKVFSGQPGQYDPTGQITDSTDVARRAMLAGGPRMATTQNSATQFIIIAGVPVIVNGETVGAVVLSTLGGEIDSYLVGERRQILQVFFLAILTSIMLSILLANTIGRPLRDLADAARRGSAENSGRSNKDRIKLPDLTDRPDEIGELSRQLRNMTNALYDRIEANEIFAADVAHEIKNPLTSLRSAVETMHYTKTDDQRQQLMDVIRNDVIRIDRLITDISNASRLDSELAKDDMETFNLCDFINNIVAYQAELAAKSGVQVLADLPETAMQIAGLGNRLAQVFANLITNAVSFVPDGGHVLVRLIDLGDSVRIEVNDTGPGIPEENLEDIFKRFYSSRPDQEFGNNSGLGLAISSQIVAAHGGKIWAENLRDISIETVIGARFVVILPK